MNTLLCLNLPCSTKLFTVMCLFSLVVPISTFLVCAPRMRYILFRDVRSESQSHIVTLSGSHSQQWGSGSALALITHRTLLRLHLILLDEEVPILLISYITIHMIPLCFSFLTYGHNCWANVWKAIFLRNGSKYSGIFNHRLWILSGITN
jgi:hypothetical protein